MVAPTNASSLAEHALSQPPILTGRSKVLHAMPDGRVAIRLVPSLSSFTFDRHELVDGTAELRLEFYEAAVEQLAAAGIETAFVGRVTPDAYIAEMCDENPFEVIVKNRAVGSTTRKYPGLVPDGQRLTEPIVKFDYRTDPEDQPIARDYVRMLGLDAERMERLALRAAAVLQAWLHPRELIDICFIIGRLRDRYVITSEISPDCMRLQDADGRSLDKDLFRQGASHATILETWRELNDSLR